jgi:hypothetical protein
MVTPYNEAGSIASFLVGEREEVEKEARAKPSKKEIGQMRNFIRRAVK